jgi:hypothetical protein
MSWFHNAEEAAKQKQGTVYIPQENDHLAGFGHFSRAETLCRINRNSRKSFYHHKDNS